MVDEVRVQVYDSRISCVQRALRSAEDHTRVGELTDENTKEHGCYKVALLKSEFAMEVDDVGLFE